MTPYKYIRNCWYVAGLSHEFETGKLTGHRIAGKPIIIWRTDKGKGVAFDDRCAHKRFPLSRGRLVEDGTLECAYHGLRYNDKGKCVAIPSQPDGPIPRQAKINPFPILEQDGLVWVWAGDAAKAKSQTPPRRGPERSVGSGAAEWIVDYVSSLFLMLIIKNLSLVLMVGPVTLHSGIRRDMARAATSRRLWTEQ